MNKKILSVVSILFAAAALFFGIYNYISRPEIAYIRISAVLDGYAGTKEARINYEKQLGDWKANLDTLKSEYNAQVEIYEGIRNTLSVANKDLRETELRLKAEEIMRYENAVSQQAQEEEQKMTDGILIKVNDFVKRYAEERGYEIVLGATPSGNIMFGKEYLDITEEILAALNEEYR